MNSFLREGYDDQEEAARYGKNPETCTDCRQSATGRCKFHRELEQQRDEELWDDDDGSYPLSRSD